VVLRLSEVSIHAKSPLRVSGSTVTVVVDGASAVVSQAAESAGIGCAEDLNVTLQATDQGWLSAMGGANAPGVGADALESCKSLTTVNGSVRRKAAR
jgi:hypothetical protein